MKGIIIKAFRVEQTSLARSSGTHSRNQKDIVLITECLCCQVAYQPGKGHVEHMQDRLAFVSMAEKTRLYKFWNPKAACELM
jgi:hypothetical protein